ncbi:MAG TPA: catalase family peroxidase [Acetobacteraceae bacterium]|nr:catalase family peroxidase [Acetobacteraceae bacterium]
MSKAPDAPLGARDLPRGRAALLASLAAIGLVVAGTAAAFAYTAGWLSPDRLTPARMVDALSRRGGDPIGHRRNHSKGICFTGTFIANGAGTRLSTAPMFVAGRYPVIGRFAIAVGDPAAPDASGRVRSMAIRIVAPDGQEWRSGMNDSPVFVVATPQEFYALTLASDVDPATGPPDPRAVQHYFATHPDGAAFVEWAHTAPWTASYAEESYNSLDAFRFVDAAGASHPVRWSMRATVPAEAVTQAALAKLGPDFLEQDLRRRLAQGPLRWHLVVTLGAAGDPTNDATKAWPATRPEVDIGTLEVQQAQDEASGPCRDFNYDPLVLPAGIRPSDDPLLPARSSAYANSFDRRTAEAAAWPHTNAAGAAQ